MIVKPEGAIKDAIIKARWGILHEIATIIRDQLKVVQQHRLTMEKKVKKNGMTKLL